MADFPNTDTADGIWSLKQVRRAELGGTWPTFGITATGGTITDITDGGIDYRVHTFTSSGTFEVTSGSGEVEYLVVAGGGAGGSSHGGGGGSGGLLQGTQFSVSEQSYPITVGAGAPENETINSKGSNGSDSVFDSFTAVGGGGGAHRTEPAGLNGGSGGGAGGSGTGTSPGGDGVAGQGNDGGVDTPGGGQGDRGGGGGGAGEPGNTYAAGAGGDGLELSISGTLTYYAGGGGGAEAGRPDVLVGSGGLGGGGGEERGSGGGYLLPIPSGTFSGELQVGVPGLPNTGGGGSGGGSTYQDRPSYGGAGGSGIVIIRYPI